MYVDDLVTEVDTLDKVKNLKEKSVVLFQKGGFSFRKCNSNASVSETVENTVFPHQETRWNYVIFRNEKVMR